MKHIRIVCSAFFVAAFAACGSSSTSEPDFADGTPDVAGLTLETSGGAADGLATAQSRDVAREAVAAAAAGSPCAATPAAYEFTCNALRGIAGVNKFVRAAVEPVEALVAADDPSSPSSDVRVYGPAPLPAGAPVANFKLSVRSLGNNAFNWKLEAQPSAGGSAPFAVVMAGHLQRSEVAHRGRGVIGIDLDALATVNSTAFSGKGKLLAAFAHSGAAKAVTIAAKGFVAESGAAPVTAVFSGWKDEAGRARVRLAAASEFLAPKSGADAGDELLLSRIGYWPAVGGRTALGVLGGDVPSYSVAGFTVKAFVGLECFGAGFGVTYRALFACGMTSGGASECAPDTTFNSDATKAIGTDANGVPAAGACAANTDLFSSTTSIGTDPTTTDPEPGAPAQPDAPPASLPEF